MEDFTSLDLMSLYIKAKTLCLESIRFGFLGKTELVACIIQDTGKESKDLKNISNNSGKTGRFFLIHASLMLYSVRKNACCNFNVVRVK